MTCVAKGGRADFNGSVQIGDTVLFIDDLDIYIYIDIYIE